jgi:hypothetical protein
MSTVVLWVSLSQMMSSGGLMFGDAHFKVDDGGDSLLFECSVEVLDELEGLSAFSVEFCD